ncbi:MAG: hypothetical protein WDM91_10975 [Rhizomicrobium sp.]
MARAAIEQDPKRAADIREQAARLRAAYGAKAPCEPGYDGSRAVACKVRDPDGDGKRVLVTMRKIDRLEWLFSKRNIEEYHVAAGHRLQDLFQKARMQGFVQLTGGGGGMPRTTLADAKLDAMEEYGDAIRKLGQRSRHVVEMLLIDDGNASLEACTRAIRVHPKAGLPLLLDGLDVLARHWGYI